MVRGLGKCQGLEVMIMCPCGWKAGGSADVAAKCVVLAEAARGLGQLVLELSKEEVESDVERCGCEVGACEECSADAEDQPGACEAALW